jgi:4-hydroxysphinganine ceramide fatty acyl 2-hydroxylase
MHYALHHTRLPAYVREMKRYHLAHHYKNFELGFGVTSALPFSPYPIPSNSPPHVGKVWDYVFNTALVI